MLKFALANLRSRPGRTVLSIIGLTIAIAGMVGLFSIAGGIASLIETSFGQIDGVVVLQNGAPIPLFSDLPASWGEEMRAIEGVAVVNPELWSRANLIDGKPILTPPRLLFGTDLPSRIGRRDGVIADDVQEGRFLDLSDVGTNHAVISRQIADEFGKSLGDEMTVNGQQLTVVGIYETGSILIDVTIVIDINLLRRMTRSASDAVSAFYVEPELGVGNEAIIARIKEHFKDRELPPWDAKADPLTAPGVLGNEVGELIAPLLQWLLPPQRLDSRADKTVQKSSTEMSREPVAREGSDSNPRGDAGPITVRTVAEYGQEIQGMTDDLDIILALLTGLGVTIALSSIFNTMLMSVTERIVEFGILRANGWSQGDVVKLISCEAALLGAGGGLLGILLGWMATILINRIWPDRVHLYAGPLLLGVSLLFSVVVGVLGGFYPAYRASRLSPMEAIRRG